ncbi:helix-turn-helix domain-containing protein [Hyphococcus flavus]|uniref:Helix-turn-helix domain-containing protein n=1 Tax=Hyphococcus flavus TaxID=1866326 RepID=A0AAE9ZKA2_9PROT|nr:helix-turn-helix domain-containing protein [Hyphococcus flavus]WDI32721.1 helix-turn-helix domain-containing protein [Hyphococcus flavus]
MRKKPAPSGQKISTKPYWITRKDQITCLASAVRLDILDHLVGAGPMSIKELAYEIGMKPSALYHHFAQLQEVDLIFESGTRIVNRKSEKLYATPSRKMRLLKALGDPSHAEEMQLIVSALARRIDREFADGLDNEDRKTSGVGRNLGFYRAMNRPSKATLREINKKLDEIADLLWEEKDPNQPMISLSWVMAPLETD